MENFGRLSYLAERLILEKGPHWEYKLTAEVLRFDMNPIVRRWKELSRRLYIKTSRRIIGAEALDWISLKYHEVGMIVNAFSSLMNVEFKRAWGEPGVAGSDVDIVATCRLYAEMCASALAWEEDTQFTKLDDVFEEIRELMIGIAGGLVDQASQVPVFIANIFELDEPSGEHKLSLVADMPEGWSEKMELAMDRARIAYLADVSANQ